MGKVLPAVAAVFAGLGFGVAALAQEGPCQEVYGQAEIGGVLQPISGVACLQPDGTWQLVGGPGTYSAPDYYYDPWYWAPVGVGFGATVIFVDRFHHFHHLHHVFFRRPGFHGGFHDGFRGGFHGGFHGGGFHGGHGGAGSQGGFHGGGMHR